MSIPVDRAAERRPRSAAALAADVLTEQARALKLAA